MINTYLISGVTNKQKEFLTICYEINTRQNDTFCVLDFVDRGYSRTNFRQYVLKLKPLIVKTYSDSLAFYVLQGITLTGYKKITTKDTGAGSEMLKTALQNLQHKNAMMHDIKLKFNSDNLHAILKQNGFIPSKENSLIKIKHHFDEIDSDVVFTVYPQSTQIHISNTYKPIVRDPNGILNLGMVLGHIRQFLIGKSHDIATIPFCTDWIVYHYHLNKDGPRFSGKSVEITVNDFDSIMIRFYTKQMPDGKMIDRLERTETRPKLLSELMSDSLNFTE